MAKGKPLTEDQLALILQACTDFAKQMLEEQGGFYPFGARVKLSGEIDFLQSVPDSDPVDLQKLYRKAEEALAEQARKGEILGAAIVANAELPEDPADDFRDAIRVLIDAPGYCRLIYQPYRMVLGAKPGKLGAIETGEMFPVDAAQAIFSG
jgi:hypothetical protein